MSSGVIQLREPPYAFGPYLLDPRSGTLRRDGILVPLGYRPMLVLAALAAQAGAVVPKETLINAAWPGLSIEESNLSVQIFALRKLLGRGPDGDEWIATMPRIGYRLAAGPAPEGSGASPGPSIAVLPFKTLSTDIEQQYFADGLAEELIIQLARMPWLSVASRSASFHYRGETVDARHIGRELGVRYVLDGSVRRSADRVRVAAELIDAATGRAVWAQRYDDALDEFFELQDRMTAALIATIEPRLYDAERARSRARPPQALDAWTLVMRAMPSVWTWGSADEIDAAAVLLGQAISMVPDGARANSLLAWTQAARIQLGLDIKDGAIATARETALRALRSDPEDPWTHFCAGYVHMVGRDFEPAVAALNEALALNPAMSIAHMILGSAYGYGGQPQKGLACLAIANRLSPRDFTQPGALATTGMCHMIAGHYAEAIANLRRAVELRPHFGTAWRTLAASAGLAGDLRLADHALVASRRLQPGFSLAWVEKFHPIVGADDRSRYMHGLAAAGLT